MTTGRKNQSENSVEMLVFLIYWQSFACVAPRVWNSLPGGLDLVGLALDLVD